MKEKTAGLRELDNCCNPNEMWCVVNNVNPRAQVISTARCLNSVAMMALAYPIIIVVMAAMIAPPERMSSIAVCGAFHVRLYVCGMDWFVKFVQKTRRFL